MSRLPRRIESPRLWLRQLEITDAEPLHAELQRSHAHLAPWLDWVRKDTPLVEREAFCRRVRGLYACERSLTVGLWRKRGERLVGVMDARDIDWCIPSAEVGYWGAGESQGRGYLSEALRALATCLIEELRFERLWLSCDARNLASQRVAERSGFELEGRLRRHRRDAAGRLGDTLLYARLR